MATQEERVERLRTRYGTQDEKFECDLLAIGVPSRNRSVAAQVVADTTRVMLTGSNLVIPKFQVGATLRWRITMTKTAAGTAASTFDIGVGKTATAAGLTARVSFTKPAGTAAVDEACIEITCVCRTVAATGVLVGQFTLTHNLAATGHAVIPSVVVTTVSAGFVNTGEDLIVGVMVTAGAADALTFELVEAEASYVGK